MASEPNSGQSDGTSTGAVEAHIAPWASKWDALPEPAVPTAAARRVDTAPIPSAPRRADPEPGRSLFASKLMAGISTLAFALLALLVLVCWPDIANLVG